MNTETRQPVTERLAGLNPFDINVMVRTPALKPHQTRRGSDRSTTNLESDPQFGCVDWYLYHHEAG